MAGRILPTKAPEAAKAAQAPASTPTTHAYNDPDLSPIEFLLAVMHASHIPMSTRIEAARGLLPYTEPRPTNSFPPRCKIIIGGLGPYTASPEPRSPADPTENHSQNPLSPNITLTHDAEPPAPQNLTTIPNTPPLIDYSTPPTPAELQEIKAAINQLRPDLAHLPVPEFHLCPCGHWITGEYDCCRRELSKLN